MEGLIDMGRADIAKQAMKNLEIYQKEDGSVPGYHNVNWVCSTGLLQLALVWFRLGNLERGNRAFEYACKLQNESGGWFGSYPHGDFPKEEPGYITNAEISWAVKYFVTIHQPVPKVYSLDCPALPLHSRTHSTHAFLWC